MARRSVRWAIVGVTTAVLTVSACAQLPQTSADPVAVPAPVTTPDTAPAPTAEPTPSPEPTPSASPSSLPTPTAKSSARSTATTSPKASPSPTQQAGPAIMRAGQSSERIKELQARLAQVGWYSGDVTGNYGSQTSTAVAGFQSKRGLPATGNVDQSTWNRLVGMSRQPTAAELGNAPKPTATTSQAPKAVNVDSRCMTGRVICISKRTDTLRWMQDGKVLMTMDVRFGTSEYPTREGTFNVQWKSRDHVSNIYHTSMPYALFFSGGQAVHYSPDFAARGYSGGSHGCVNLRSKSGAASLYNQAQVGDKVVVYR